MKSIFIGDIQTMCISLKSCLEIIFFVPASFLLRFSFDWNSNNERRKNEEETKENRRAIEESVKIERISAHFKATRSISKQSEALRTVFVERSVFCLNFAYAMRHRSFAGKQVVFQSEVT